MQALWFQVALLGDLQFIVPAFLLTCAVLWRFDKPHEVQAMAASFTATLILIGALKFMLNPFHLSVFAIQLHAHDMPSGHAGMSMVFYGGVAMLLARRDWAWAKVLAILSMGVAALVSVSVWRLWWHSRLETISGDLLGAVVLLFSERLRRRHGG